MNIFIAIDRDVVAPGFYRVDNGGGYAKGFLKNIERNFSDSKLHSVLFVEQLIFKSVLQAATLKKFVKGVWVKPTSEMGFLESKSIITSVSEIRSSGLNYEDNIFDGYIKSKDHMEQLLALLPGNDSRVIITNRNNLSEFMVNRSIPPSGVYLSDIYGEKALYGVSDYSEDVWRRVRSAIVDVFSNLGANSVSIKDVTDGGFDAKINVSEKLLKKLSLELGFSVKRKVKFDFDLELDPHFNKEAAEMSLSMLRPVEQLHQVAKHILAGGRVKSVHQNIDMDISFGVNFNALTLMQGVFEGGNQRKLNVKVIF